MSCTKKFPDHLINLIKNSKYVHLATASIDCIPSVSLMNYTYIPSDKSFEQDKSKNDYIIFATSDDTEKYINIINNPTVALLFHDWVTANNLSVRKQSLSQTSTPQPESTPQEHPSKLLNLLQQLNQSELNEMSATIKGHAVPIQPNTDESTYYKSLLLKTNPDAEVFILGDNTVIVKVKIESAKVTDSENNTSVYK
ncbi:hypothetical protein KAFR_0B00420 [Kazachstania africana CBS 2517]|uniref:Pyridoxamine 5'-phosphate oxidase N-terminal domain-containing protein n=1 Tax=Kazachstania africana (strain ATCC 22294 / BCRC 22015 / CBS 2517 / CECT 1963 / NBRC 1671 / NRRL Y-8276) TaxID=1071382 RepID=H2APP2_KAZAF|nr:hypothetical protein KAFR_0B00420 [Kazachstania africana CBS 2517]CCF56342.1 hypothetical protein KAFR_0B00420 [Kazachstania africana CBS 2517]